MMESCIKKSKLGTVNLGLKLFERNKNEKCECPYRLVQEGLEVLLPYMDGHSRQVQVSPDFFKSLTSKNDLQLSFATIEEQFGKVLAD